MLVIDGSEGEGGGQILRSALALSIITQQPFQIVKIRAGRPKPGLQPQHLAAVRAASTISGAEVSGAQIGSSKLLFHPKPIQPGKYQFDLGTAGSTTLVLQTVLPPLLEAKSPSQIVIKGGTHNPFAPCVTFLEQVFLPVLKKMGANCSVQLERAGFYPKGGGILHAQIEPAEWKAISILERGKLIQKKAEAILARLPRHIGEREIRNSCQILDWEETSGTVTELSGISCAGNVLCLSAIYEHISNMVTAHGRVGISAEEVAMRGARELSIYLESTAPVGEHLSDQLLLPFALAGGGKFLASHASSHLTTNIDIINRFLPGRLRSSTEEGGILIEVGG